MELWLIFIVLSAILLGAWILMLRRDVMHEPNTQVFSISYLGIIVLVPIMSWLIDMPIEHGAFQEHWVLFLTLNAALIATLSCTTLALKSLPLTVVGPLRNLSPLFVAFLGFFLLGEVLSPINLLGLLIVVLGVVFLDIDIRHPTQIKTFCQHMRDPGVFLLLIAAVAVSFAAVIMKVLLSHTNALTLIFYNAIILTIAFWIIYIVQERKLPTQGLSFHETLWLLLTGITIMLADVFYFAALAFPGAMVSVVFGVRRLSNLFVTIFGGAILHESNGTYKAVMCAVMIGGTILLVL